METALDFLLFMNYKLFRLVDNQIQNILFAYTFPGLPAFCLNRQLSEKKYMLNFLKGTVRLNIASEFHRVVKGKTFIHECIFVIK